ncbi:MAG: hypothetical protein AAF828_05035 [Bacteroidota bacterium]
MVYVRNKGGTFIGLAPVTDDQHITPTIFPELSIDLREVFPPE